MVRLAAVIRAYCFFFRAGQRRHKGHVAHVRWTRGSVRPMTASNHQMEAADKLLDEATLSFEEYFEIPRSSSANTDKRRRLNHFGNISLQQLDMRGGKVMGAKTRVGRVAEIIH